jgi:hypothetical protein
MPSHEQNGSIDLAMAYEIDGGIYRRRICPVSVPFSGPIGPYELSRKDHDKHTHAQVEQTQSGRRLWWLLDKLSEGEKSSYRLHKGVEREGAPRVRLRPSAFGWRASVRKEFTSELLTPMDGSPKFSFRPGGMRTSTLTMANRPAPMHRHRMGDPVVNEGPVFASLAVDYTYLDKLDRTLAVEKHYFRVFDGPVSMLLVDWSVTLVATSGPLPMDAEHGWMPTIMIDPAGDSLVAADSGWRNVDVVDRPGALVSLTVEDRTTSVMIRSDSAGFPFRWTVKGEHNLEAKPDLEGMRLAIGESATFHLRMASMTGKNGNYIHDRYMDFDQPPTPTRVRVEAAEASSEPEAPPAAEPAEAPSESAPAANG